MQPRKQSRGLAVPLNRRPSKDQGQDAEPQCLISHLIDNRVSRKLGEARLDRRRIKALSNFG